MLPVLFQGDKTSAYRDPACVYFDGAYHLFFTLSVKENGYMYNYVARSISRDLLQWTEPKILTEKDNSKNYCSPGSIIRHGEEYLMCITSYPLPKPYAEDSIADETARLHLMRTGDFQTFTPPELIHAKGKECPPGQDGRMIDPFILEDKDQPGRYLLFFKQNGVSLSASADLKHWEFQGSAEAGENACVLVRDGRYLLIHSPENGIGFKESEDLHHWTDKGVCTLNQTEWDWADGRLTAAFAMEAQGATDYQYIMFFHGSREDCPPETHGAASLAMAFTDDFEHFFYHPIKGND